MAVPIPQTSLTGAVVGQTFTIPLGSIAAPASLRKKAEGKLPHIALLNESGCGLLVTFPITNDQFPLGAGGWTPGLEIDPEEVNITVKVLYILPNQPVALLLGTYYFPWETPTPAQVLGNSPIGLSAVTLPVTQVIQDGQPTGQTILEATPTASGQNLLMTTDGVLKLVKILFIGTPGNASVDWESNLVVHRTPQAGVTAQSVLFQTWDGSMAPNVFQVGGTGTGATAITSTGAFGTVANQATAGSFGVPVIVAQTPAAGVTVTTTGIQTLFSFTPAANGLYEMRGTFTQVNGSASNYDFWMSYTDPNTGGNPKASLLTSQGGQPLINLAIGASTGTSIPCVPATGFNQGGHAILAQFNDHAGTPGDIVYAQLWRLS